MKRHEAYPSQYLKQEDIDHDIVLTIARVEMTELQRPDGGVETKPVMQFKDSEKVLVLNVSNWDSIEELYGPESDSWPGKQITLFVDADVRFGGKRVGGIRVRSQKPASQQVSAN